MSNVHIVDDHGGLPGPFNPALVSGDDGDGILEPGETWVYTATGALPRGLYFNTANASGTGIEGSLVRDAESACAFGVDPGIEVVKAVNAVDPLHPTPIEDANGPIVPELLIGSKAVYTYKVRNTGNIPLSGVSVVDDNGTADPADDVVTTYISGDDGDGLLEEGETWLFRFERFVTAGSHVNTATATGTSTRTAQTVTDTDLARVFGRTGAEGLTPGFWKTNVDEKNAVAWPRWNGELVDLPGTPVSSLFSSHPQPSPTCRSRTRSAPAAAASRRSCAMQSPPSSTPPTRGSTYPLTVTEIVKRVNDAVASGDAQQIETLKNLLQSYNELESDLDANGNVPAPKLVISGGTVVEGHSGSKTVAVTISLTGPALNAVTVSWATGGGTAMAGIDYISASGFLTFLPGEATKTVLVTVLGDGVIEPNETFGVALANAQGAAVQTGTATVTITNDDSPAAVTVTAADGSGAETGQDAIVFTVTRSGSLAGALTVTLQWSGTAAFGSDYTISAAGANLGAGGTTLTFADGASVATVTVTPADDGAVEPTESVVLAIPTGSGYTGGTSASGTIADNDTVALPSVTVAATDASGAEAGANTITFTLTRTSTTGSLTVAIGWSGSAAAPSDYGVPPTSVTFAAGAATATVVITPVDDADVEGAETVVLTVLTGAGYAVGAPASATATVADNDLPSVTVAATDASGAEAGGNTITFTFTRTSSAGAVVVNIGWSGSATSGSDYVALPATVSFAAGSTTATVVVTPLDDSAVESPETVVASVLAGSGYAVGTPATATATLVSDDLPQLFVDDMTVTESDKNTTTIQVTVRLSAPALGTVTATLRTVAGTATAGSDFQSVTATVTFAAGVAQVTFAVKIVNDRVNEPTETFTVVVDSVTGATVADGSAVVTILDNDRALVAAAGPTADGDDAASLSEIELQGTAAIALADWRLAQPDADLADVVFAVVDLPALKLAEVDGRTVFVDRTAAGLGWSLSGGGVDLLTVLLHELGHVLGLEHKDDGVMAPTLAAGERRVLAPEHGRDVLAWVELRAGDQWTLQRLRAPLRALLVSSLRPGRIAAPAPQRLRAHRATKLRAGASGRPA